MKRSINCAVILAGGLGTRLKPFTDKYPKPMYPVDGVPFIEKLIYQIKNFGINKIIILLGYKADIIMSYVGNGEKYGVNIIYDVTPINYDTLQRIYSAKDLIDEEFLLMYADNYCPINFNLLVNNFYKHNAYVELSVYNNLDNYTRSNILIDNDNLVLIYDSNHIYSNLSGVEIGYSIVRKKVLELMDENDKNYSKDLFPKVIKKKKMYATITEHRYYSIGSFDRMELTKEFFRPKKVVFLDRDGVLNKKPPKACYVECPDEFIWLDGAKEAIKLLNDNNIITILVSNQPGIARGNLTVEMLNKIHQKMQDDLKEINAKIDYIYYCPHNWDEGCYCRKPNPGMLLMAQKKLSLDLTECTLFGDDERDIEAAQRVNCKSKLITEDYQLIDAIKDYLKEEM